MKITERMVEAGLVAWAGAGTPNTSAQTRMRTTLEHALGAGVSMDRLAALQEATALVDASIQAAKESFTKPNGYTDGFKPPTVGERTQAVLELAAFLTGDQR
jgi:hypothetical protein